MADFDLTVSSVDVRPGGNRSVDISFSANENSVLENIDIRDALSFYGSDSLLSLIGADEAKVYFGLVDSE